MLSKRNMRIDEAAAYLGISRRTVYRLISDNEIVALKIRGALRVTVESLDVYCRRRIVKFLDDNQAR